MTRPVKREGPGGATGATPKHRANGYHQNSGDYRHETLTADERREQQLLEELQALGYGVWMPCTHCSRPLTAAKSLARHIGPVCATRAKAVES